MIYTLSSLPYNFHELDPFISEKALLIRYFKVHKGIIDELNSLLNYYPKFQNTAPADLICNIELLPKQIRHQVKRCAGNYLNHAWFWNSLMPKGYKNPKGELFYEINYTFDSFSNFQEEFSRQALRIEEDGWCWLVRHDGLLSIMTTNNSDCPLSNDIYPLLGLDMWEQSYHLSHQDKKIEYVNLFWNFINWGEIEERYKESKFNAF